MNLAVSLDPNQVSPGLLGFLIVCVLGVGVWLLCRNMGKHLTRLDAEYKAELAAAEEQQDAAEASAGAKPSKKPATQA
jgi:hypothetical protein